MTKQKQNISTTPKKAKRNLYREITQMIIDKMKDGQLIWKKGFSSEPAQNWVSKTHYSGINAVLLNFLYNDELCPFYATRSQIKALGGHIKKEQKQK